MNAGEHVLQIQPLKIPFKHITQIKWIVGDWLAENNKQNP